MAQAQEAGVIFLYSNEINVVQLAATHYSPKRIAPVWMRSLGGRVLKSSVSDQGAGSL
jgi:hypothetical protein